MTRSLQTAILATLALATWHTGLRADEVRYFEKDGVTYRETRQVVRRPVVETKLEARDCTVYRDKLTTQLQDTPRTIPVAITEYHWVPVWHRPLNPFAAPYLTYQMVPQTRWESRSDTVKTAVTRREVVPEKITQHVPVTTQRFVEDEIISRVAVGTRPPGTTPTSSLAGSAPAAAPATLPPSGSRYSQLGTPPPGALAAPKTLAPPAGAAEVANRPALGGVMKYDSDPPRGASDWRSGDSSLRR
jgi:hypothetical protein